VILPSTVGGTAGNPADYTISASPLTIAAGNTTGAITVTVIAGTLAEPNETVIVTFGNPTNATLGAPAQHILTIPDNDLVPPTISNISVVLIQLNDAARCSLDQPPASSFQVSFDYADANGNGPTSISGAGLNTMSIVDQGGLRSAGAAFNISKPTGSN